MQIITASYVWAACSSPAGINGQMGYRVTGVGRYQYCNDTNWVTIFDELYGPVAHLKFDEASGSTAFDAVNAYNVILNNGAVWQTAGGQIGGAADFSLSAGQYAHLNAGIPGPIPYTLSFWIRPTSTSTTYAAVITETDSTGLWFDPNSDILKMYVNDNETLTSVSSIANNSWHHIVMTDDGTTSRLYVNGVEEDTSADRVNFMVQRIAGGYWGVSYFFDGRIDDLRVYKRALTASEISSVYDLSIPDYNCTAEKSINFIPTFNYLTVCRDGFLRNLKVDSAGSGCASVGQMDYFSNQYWYCNGVNWLPLSAYLSAEPTAGLVHKWSLDESSGTVANDAVGTDNGTLVDGPVWQPSSGKISGALQFDGVDDIVSLPAIALSSPFSLSFWMKRTIDVDSDYISIITEDTITGVWHDTNSTAISVLISNNEWLSGGAIQTNSWAHVTITDDGTTSRLYVNGEEVDNDTNRVGFTINALADSYGGSSDERFTGFLDDVRIYNTVLTPSEVESLYISVP